MFRAISLLFCGASVIGACAPSQPGARPVAELSVPPLDKNGTASAPIATDGRAQCTMNLFIGRMKKSDPACYIDEKISKEVGKLVVPCGGDGPAIVSFGPQRFNGTINEGAVTFEIETELDWNDGCHWGTHAVIRGLVVRNGAPIHEPVEWEYVERVLSGSNCVTPCRAFAKVQSMPEGTMPKP